MTAQVKVSDPERNYVLFDTNYPTLCLSCVDYAGTHNQGRVSTKNSKGARFPLVVLPIYPISTGISPYLFSQTQYARNNDYDDIDSAVKADKPNFNKTIPVFMFDVPELALNIDGKVGLRTYNPQTGDITFDSRALPLNVIGLCRDGVKLDPNKIYGYVNLLGGVYAQELRTLSRFAYPPYPIKGYYNADNIIVSADMSKETYDKGGYYARKPKKQNMSKTTNPYEKFYAWYWPHLLVDLTHIYNALGIDYKAPFV